jgi:hypothetical protein
LLKTLASCERPGADVSTNTAHSDAAVHNIVSGDMSSPSIVTRLSTSVMNVGQTTMWLGDCCGGWLEVGCVHCHIVY